MSSDKNKVLDSLTRMPRFGPALFAVLILGIVLLFLKELDENIKSFMIPSLVVYALGSSFLSSFHRMLGYHYKIAEDPNNEKPIPLGWKIVLLVMHILWFASFVFYNFYRNVL